MRQFTAVDDRLPTTISQMANQLKELHMNIASHRRMETYITCLMGRNLHYIKTITSKKNLGLVKFAQDYLPRTNTKSAIYFMMNLYLLCNEHSRLSYVTISIRKLKAKLKLVRKLVDSDPVYWKNVG